MTAQIVARRDRGMMKKVPIRLIRRDGGTQSRARLDAFVIEEYQDAYKSKSEMPPVVVFYDGTDYWLADGFYRTAAAEDLKMRDMDCEIRQGTQRDAILFSVGANAAHGLRRTNEDKHRAVMMLLNDPEWEKWSDREIARRCGVSHDLVAQLRPVTGGIASEKEVITTPARAYTTKHGTRATMNTENIGHNPVEVESDDVDTEEVSREEGTMEVGSGGEEEDDVSRSVERIMDCIKVEIDGQRNPTQIRSVVNAILGRLSEWSEQLGGGSGG